MVPTANPKETTLFEELVMLEDLTREIHSQLFFDANVVGEKEEVAPSSNIRLMSMTVRRIKTLLTEVSASLHDLK